MTTYYTSSTASNTVNIDVTNFSTIFEVRIGDQIKAVQPFSWDGFSFLRGEILEVVSYDGPVGVDKRYTIKNREGKEKSNWNMDKRWFELVPRISDEELAKAKSLPSHDELKDFFGV